MHIFVLQLAYWCRIFTDFGVRGFSKATREQKQLFYSKAAKKPQTAFFLKPHKKYTMFFRMF
jgi:hypothetical protein